MQATTFATLLLTGVAGLASVSLAENVDYSEISTRIDESVLNLIDVASRGDVTPRDVTLVGELVKGLVNFKLVRLVHLVELCKVEWLVFSLVKLIQTGVNLVVAQLQRLQLQQWLETQVDNQALWHRILKWQ